MGRSSVLARVLSLAFAVAAVRGTPAQSRDTTRAAVERAAQGARALRVVVSTSRRRLWVVRGASDTLRSARVGVASERTLRFAGRTWRFAPPVGIRAVVRRETDPIWIRLDWSYVEVARDHRFRIESLAVDTPRPLSGGGALVVRGRRVGVLRASTFEPWPVDDEIVIDRVLFVPPPWTDNRAMRGILGGYRLDLGDGFGIHGTDDPESVGRAVTHGCLRLGDADLAWVYAHVPTGTRVYIF